MSRTVLICAIFVLPTVRRWIKQQQQQKKKKKEEEEEEEARDAIAMDPSPIHSRTDRQRHRRYNRTTVQMYHIQKRFRTVLI
jgi:uncharacterized membrane protein YhiD involved in acid resistance